jgi:hypothetical protein
VSGTPREKIAAAFRKCLLRPPANSELETLVELYENACESLGSHPDDAVALATNPLGVLPDNLNAIDAAAMTVVGNVLLNLDEMFMKR